MIFSFLTTLFVQSGKAALLIVVIFLVRRMFGERLSPATRFALWGLVPITLLFCISVPSALSVYNYLPQRIAIQQPQEPEMKRSAISGHASDSEHAPNSRQAPAIIVPAPVALSEVPPLVETASHESRSARIDGRTILFAGWLGGCGIMVLVFSRQVLVCRRWVNRSQPVRNERALTVFEQCARQAHCKSWLVIAESEAVSGPFLIGAIRPVLLLPRGMVESASREQLQTVFLHELAHLRRWDVWTGWVMSLLLTVHWFNPLLWLAIRRMNADREEAADALALQTLNQIERRSYGSSLIDIAEHYVTPNRTPGLVGISESGRFLKRRIEMIKHVGTWKLRWTASALFLGLLLGIVTITDAQPPSERAEKIRQLEEQQREIGKQLQQLKLEQDDAVAVKKVEQGKESTEPFNPNLNNPYFKLEHDGTVAATLEEAQRQIGEQLRKLKPGQDDAVAAKLEEAQREIGEQLRKLKLEHDYVTALIKVEEHAKEVEKAKKSYYPNLDQGHSTAVHSNVITTVEQGTEIMKDVVVFNPDKMVELKEPPTYPTAKQSEQRRAYNEALALFGEKNAEELEEPSQSPAPYFSAAKLKTILNSGGFLNRDDEIPDRLVFSDFDGNGMAKVWLSDGSHYEGTATILDGGAKDSILKIDVRKANDDSQKKWIWITAYVKFGHDERAEVTLNLKSQDGRWDATFLKSYAFPPYDSGSDKFGYIVKMPYIVGWPVNETEESSTVWMRQGESMRRLKFDNTGEKKPRSVVFSDLSSDGTFKVVIQEAEKKGVRYEGTGKEIKIENETTATGSRYMFRLDKKFGNAQKEEPVEQKRQSCIGMFGWDLKSEKEFTFTLTLESEDDDWNGSVLQQR